MNAVLLACSSLTKDVEAAQERMHTSHPMIWLDRNYHADPKEMRRQIQKTLDSLDQSVDTVLVAMGFCGGSWGDLTARQRIVIPCVDDCITLLLHTDDRKASNLKQKGHFYFREPDAGNISLESMEKRLCQSHGESQGRALFHHWFDSFTHIDIIDTGTYDSYSPAHLRQVQRDAALTQCAVRHVPGSVRILEKLVSGQWDEQFLVVEPEHSLSWEDFL